ncbi:hypothetical protein IH879_08270 [candidate division KSB1 bacterium]|nr:hypothetical protein [candidate division KSB1 bacterium]
MAGQEFKNRIRVYKDFADLPNIECKARELNQVLLNLLVNAARSIEGNGEIKIKTSEEGGKIVLKFRDNGRGFSQIILREFLIRVFQLRAPEWKWVSGSRSLTTSLKNTVAK